jgi:S-formylglutathione hydrolase
MQTIAQHRCFDGTLGYFSHAADSTACRMKFSVFLPPGIEGGHAPVLWWLSGLTCSEDNFTVKAGAYRAAAEAGLIVVAPDTSPRGSGVPDDEAYDLGQGAGFYVDATESPWREHYNMYTYITDELPSVVFAGFPADSDAQGIAGHSMGGHGALVAALRNPDQYRSISAFAPIVAPSRCPWGRKAFSAYLGADEQVRAQYDATELMLAAGDRSLNAEILIDQGLADDFLDEQLRPELFEQACVAARQPLRLRRHEGYDHSYFFIASFIGDHIRHHRQILVN